MSETKSESDETPRPRKNSKVTRRELSRERGQALAPQESLPRFLCFAGRRLQEVVSARGAESSTSLSPDVLFSVADSGHQLRKTKQLLRFRQ